MNLPYKANRSFNKRGRKPKRQKTERLTWSDLIHF
jgi:hypothetical protein